MEGVIREFRKCCGDIRQKSIYCVKGKEVNLYKIKLGFS